MKISKKKSEQLYNIVHEEIMQARIKVWQMKDYANISIAEIDNILSDLCKKAPQKSIGLFSNIDKYQPKPE